MAVKLFYRTQRELAYAFNEIIDGYWESELGEDVLIQSISDIYANNQTKVVKNGEFTTVLKQQCGKRRLEIVDRVLHMNGLLYVEVSSTSDGGHQ